MRKAIVLFTLLMFIFGSCNRIKTKTKETLNKGGEVVGKTASEFFEGVSEGIDKTLQCEISLSEDLKRKGLKIGKFSVESDTAGGYNNLLSLYLIFDKDFKSSISIKVFDKSKVEIGRTKIDIENKKDAAGYYDFVFDKRTYIEVKSKIIIE